jgi:uncharacterized protein YhfF
VFTRVDGLRSLEFGSPGEMRQWLTDLVVNGRKRATFGLLAYDYVAENESVETVGEILVVLDNDQREACRVRVTDVRQCSFGDVTWEMAARESEGDADLDAWRQGHLSFWKRNFGIEVGIDEPVVWVAFELVA